MVYSNVERVSPACPQKIGPTRDKLGSYFLIETTDTGKEEGKEGRRLRGNIPDG